VLTIFCLALFGQFGFKLQFLGQENRVMLTHFFQLIFEELNLSSSSLPLSGIGPCLQSA
jgi:hypothetical protein